MVRPTLSVVPTRGDVFALGCAQGDPASDTPAAPDHHRGRSGDQPTLTAMMRDAQWTVRAVCVAADPDALFVTGAAQRDAAKVCQACPVRLECLADALDNQVEYGVWGGMTERQRRAVLKKSPEVTSWRALLEEARSSATQEAAS